MKKVLLLMAIVLPLILVGCKSKEEKTKEEVISYLRNQMKNPDAFDVKFIEIRKDTIPYYLTSEISKIAKEAGENFKDVQKYSTRGSFWRDEKWEAERKLNKNRLELDEAYQSFQNEPVEVEDIAYVRYTGTNAVGGTISGSSIVIIDSENGKILGSFSVDEDFIMGILVAKMNCEGEFFSFNRFGKIETEGMTYMEQFIFDNM